MNTHVPVSISVASNLDGFRDAVFICEDDPQILADKFVEHLSAINHKASQLARHCWGDMLEQLKRKINDVSTDTETKTQYQSVLAQFEKYCDQIVVLGFNSQRYNLNLLKPYLFKCLGFGMVDEDDDDDAFDDIDDDIDAGDDDDGNVGNTGKGMCVIKKNSGYMAILTPEFRIMDISNFLGPGTALVDFYKSFNVDSGKLFFPYEKMSSYQVLMELCDFPSYDDFYSSLRLCNVLETSGKQSGKQNYEYMKKLWDEHNMTRLYDLLKLYNNADVVPFIQATENMSKFYYERDIDLFKHNFSVPGVARVMLLKSALDFGSSIPLIRDIDADLFHTMKDNITGGPSIIYHRYAEVDKTFIRGNPSYPVKSIRGDDANALYPSAYLKDYPCENYVRRHAPHFTVSGTTRHHEQMFHWMNFLSMNTGCNIQHKRNSGAEVKIGKYFVDGFCALHRRAYEFQGCFWHENDCKICKKADTITRRKRKQYTTEHNAYIQQQGYTITIITDHEFENNCKTDPELNEFVRTRTPPFFRDNSPYKRFSEQDIINAVRSDYLYCFVETDIAVPDHLYDKFSELSPLFCTCLSLMRNGVIWCKL